MKKLLSFLILSIITVAAFSQVRLSQVYGGGGNTGAPAATIKNDFIELFNAGSSAVTVPASGWSVQYASATGAFSAAAGFITVIPAGTVIGAGKYLLISEAAGASTTATPLTGDIVGTIAIGTAAGKVVLVSGTAAAPSCTDASVMDALGFGSTANCAEGTKTSLAANNQQAYVRALSGCTDTNDNSADFALAIANPRNSSTAANICGGGATATLTAAPGSFLSLQAILGSNSAEFTYSLSGSNLTAGPVVVTPSAGVRISLTSGSGYTTGSLSISYTAPTLTATSVYAIIDNTVAAGAFTGSITNVGGSTSATVNLAGNILAAEPTVQATNVMVSNINDNGFDVNWTNGNGSSRIVVVKPAASATAYPADGTLYTVPSTTGSGNTVQFVGTGTGPITVTGLLLGTNYSVRVYEYNEIVGTAGTANYDTAAAVNNPVNVLTTGLGVNLTATNFTGIAVPLYMGSNVVGTTNNYRIPALCFAKLSGLAASTVYRYYMQGAATTDLGTAATGAGNPILITYPAAGAPTFAYTTAASLTTAGGYATFTTDAAGSFTGTFGFVATGNTRFTGGSTVIPAIALTKDASPVATIRLALNQSMTVLNFGSASDSGTYVRGQSSATPGNIVGLWKSTDGTSFTTSLARPLAIALVEHPAISGAAWAGSTFVPGYDATTSGAWNTIIPNTNAAGVELIQQIDLVSGNIIGCNTSPTGIWPSGAVTVSPNGGAVTPVLITSTDAPLVGGSCSGILAVSFHRFNAAKVNNSVKLSWSTEQEINNSYFEVLRSADGINWTVISTVSAAGNSSTVLNYAVVDNSPLKGKNFYQLRAVDVNGKQNLSDIRLVLFTDKLSVIVYPNLVTDHINIILGSNSNSAAEMTLISATGAVVGEYKTQASSYSINTAGLAKGIYILKVTAAGFSTTQKIIIN